MLVSLTCKLIAIPEHAWPRLTAACDRAEPLPPPMLHAAALAAGSVFLTLLGQLVDTGAGAGQVTLAVLSAVAGYVGGGAAAVSLTPKLVQAASGFESYVPRYASAASLPAVASGAVNLVPLPALSLLAAVGGSILTFRSASLGARDFLGLEGKRRQRATGVVTLLATTPVLLGAGFRRFQ